MPMRTGFPVTVILLAFMACANAQARGDEQTSEQDELLITALEALMSAPPERALPAVRKVLRGAYSAAR